MRISNNMGKTDNYYTVLIHKELTGVLTPEETGVLESWASSSAENEALRQHLHLIWAGSQTYASDFQPNVDVAIANVKARIMKEVDAEESATPVVPISRKKRSRFSFAAAATVLLACGLFLWFYGQQDSSADWVTIRATEANMQHLLPDGSEVWLNAQTTIKYTPDFVENNRKILLDGEAFFSVLKSDGMKFVVETPHTEVTVLGTKFDVRANAEDNFTEVDVVSGRVAVVAKGSNRRKEVTSNKKARYNHETQSFKVFAEEDHNYLAWHLGKFNFKDESLGEVAKVLEHAFNVEIGFSNNKISYCPYTSLLTDRNIENILEAIQLSMGLKLDKINSKKYLFSGDGC